MELLTNILGGGVRGWLVRLRDLEGADGADAGTHTGSGHCAKRMRWMESSFLWLFLVSSGAGEEERRDLRAQGLGEINAVHNKRGRLRCERVHWGRAKEDEMGEEGRKTTRWRGQKRTTSEKKAKGRRIVGGV